MTPDSLTVQQRAERIAAWVAFIGVNLIAAMTYFILWVENPRRLSTILAVIPLQIVTDALLLRSRAFWQHMRVVEYLTAAAIGWCIWSCIHNSDWYLLPAIAFGCAIFAWRIIKLQKRNARWI